MNYDSNMASNPALLFLLLFASLYVCVCVCTECMCVDVICEYILPGIRLTIGCTRNSESFLETNVTRQVGRDKWVETSLMTCTGYCHHTYSCAIITVLLIVVISATSLVLRLYGIQ